MTDIPDDRARPLAPRDSVIFTDLDGVEGVLVDLETKQYYQLNETASLVWRGLTEGQNASAIAARMTELFEVTPSHAQASVEAAIDDLHARRLLK